MAVLGIDMGKSSIKYCCANGVGEIPNLIAKGKLIKVISGPDLTTFAVNFEGEDYVVGDEAPLCKTFKPDVTEKKATKENLVLILSVLAKLGITHAEMVVGLPVATMEHEKGPVKKLFSGPKEAVINGKKMAFEIKTNVVSEPVGTFFSLSLDDNLRRIYSSNYFNDRDTTAIIDIGYRTVDTIILQRGTLAESRDSSLSGALTLFQKAYKLFSAQFGMLTENEKIKIRNAITHNFGSTTLTMAGKFVTSAQWNEIKAYKKDLSKEIIGDIKNVLVSIRPDRVIMTGGGALLLRDELIEEDASLVFLPNPRFANAIGFYRASMIQNASAKSSASLDGTEVNS